MAENPTSTPFNIVIEAPDACRRVIKVQVPRAVFDREYQAHLTTAVRDHERPGFRKGKTPRAVVEKEHGDRLRLDAFETLVPLAYRVAVVEHGLFPLTEPRLENLTFEPEKDLAFDLHVEVRPEVQATQYQNLPVTERVAEVTDAEVDEILARLRESRAMYEKVDRPAAEGDQVVMDLQPLTEAGTPVPEKLLKSQRLILGAEQNLPAFNEGLAGVAGGQERTIEVVYPEDFTNPDVAGRTVVFRAAVKEIRHKVLPEVDDAFANQLEEGQTLLELRLRIRERLTEEGERRAAAEMDEQILAALLERHEVPVPPSMIEDYLKIGLEDLHEHNQQAGRASSAEEDQQYREAARPLAERVIKGLFLLESVRRQEGIAVSDTELDDRVAVIAAENGFDLEKFRAYVSRGEERDRIRRELEERKTYDFLLSRAQVQPKQA